MKIKYICTSFILLIYFINPCSSSGLSDLHYSVGKILIPNQKSPEAYYKLIRNENVISPLKTEMYVQNGDIIIPKKGKPVKLIFKHTECETVKIYNKTIVNCNPKECKEPGWFMDVFSDLVLSINKTIKRMPYDTTYTTTMRSTNKAESCYPSESFMLSPWPIDMTTILYGQPIYFRWDNDFTNSELLSCTKVDIVISPKKSSKKIKRVIKIGELLKINENFIAGEKYKWHIELNGKRISNYHQFRILNKKSTKNIKYHLSKISKQKFGSFSKLYQALYLQMISDMTPKMDLYADSLRLIKTVNRKNKNIELYNKLIENLFIHSLN